MSATFYGAICASSTCFAMTALVSLFTPRKQAGELAGIVYDVSVPRGVRTWLVAAAILLVSLILNWIFY